MIFRPAIRLFFRFIPTLLVIILPIMSSGQVLPEYLNFTTEITKTAEIDYLLYVPNDYHPSEGKPLLLFLTGDDYLGDINQLREVGPPGQVESGMSFDYFIAAPQLPGDVLWDTEALLELIEHIGGSYHLDETQIWLTGLGDRGGWGAWELALLYPQMFKKFAPVASAPGTNVWQAHELSIWIFHGALDQKIPVEDAEVMYYELNWDEVDVQLTVFDSLDHDIGHAVYSNPAFYQWVSGETPSYGSSSPNPRNRSMSTEITKSIDDDYLLYLPVGYDSNENDWPLVVYLHGSGSAIWDLDAIRDGGPPQLFEEGMDSDFILLCPQLHADVHWDVDRIHALTEEIIATYRINESRIYLTGLSRGGFGSWEYGVIHPELFAGVVPISARDVAGVERLANTAVWIFHGDQDTGVPWQGSETAYDRLFAQGADVHFTLYEGVGHWAWEPAYATTGLWSWLLSKVNDQVSVRPENMSMPSSLSLEQNYPNPFNSSTVIQYELPRQEWVQLTIFNLRGQEVVTLLNEESSAGQHTLLWDGLNGMGNPVSAGVYLCELKTPTSQTTIKLAYLP